MTYAKLFLNTGSSIPDRERGIRDFIGLTGPLGLTMENQLRASHVVRAVVWHMLLAGASVNIALIERTCVIPQERNHSMWFGVRPGIRLSEPVNVFIRSENASEEERDASWRRLFTECDVMFQRNRTDTIGFNIIDIDRREQG